MPSLFPSGLRKPVYLSAGSFLPHASRVEQALTIGLGCLTSLKIRSRAKAIPTADFLPTVLSIGREDEPPIGCDIEYIVREIQMYSIEEEGQDQNPLSFRATSCSNEKTAATATFAVFRNDRGS